MDENNTANAGEPERAAEKATTTTEKKAGALRRLWRWFWSPSGKVSLGTLLIVGFVAGVVFWGGFNTVVEATNTEQFCLTCHEMENNVYKEYQRSAHYTNRTGVRAVCADCHVPKEWTHKMVRKVQASNELLHHFLGTIGTSEKFQAKRLELAKSVWRTMKTTDSRECRNCHNLNVMDFSVQEKRSSDKHQEALKTGQTCIDCHKGIAHQLPAGAQDAADQLDRELKAAAGKK